VYRVYDLWCLQDGSDPSVTCGVVLHKIVRNDIKFVCKKTSFRYPLRRLPFVIISNVVVCAVWCGWRVRSYVSSTLENLCSSLTCETRTTIDIRLFCAPGLWKIPESKTRSWWIISTNSKNATRFRMYICERTSREVGKLFKSRFSHCGGRVRGARAC